jgi:hypothetical protein
VPTGGQEEKQVEAHAAGRRGSGVEAEGREQADQDLDDRNSDPRQLGVRDRKGAEDEPAGRVICEAAQLRPDVGRGAGVKEAGIAELLDPGITD